MDRLACQCGTAISCAALRRNIGPGFYGLRRHFSKCWPRSSSGENDKTGVRCQVSGVSFLDRTENLAGDRMQRCFLQVAIALACALSVFAQTGPAADIIIHNAHVWTVDPSRPEAEAVAILGDRIVAVGSRQQVDGRGG